MRAYKAFKRNEHAGLTPNSFTTDLEGALEVKRKKGRAVTW